MTTTNNTTATMIKTTAQNLANALNEGNAPEAIALAHEEGMFTFNTKDYRFGGISTITVDTKSATMVVWTGKMAYTRPIDLQSFANLISGAKEAGRLEVYAQTFKDIATALGWDTYSEAGTRLFAIEEGENILYVTKTGSVVLY